MGFHYKIYDNNKPYFITTTIVDWVEVFKDAANASCVIESLRYCQKNKGLEIHAWCLMTNHLHMIVKATNGSKLSDIIRDFKRHTSKKIIDQIIAGPENRGKLMLKHFYNAVPQKSKEIKYKIWQNGYHPVELTSIHFTIQRLKYIHNNPVKAKIVKDQCEYKYSSARNYEDKEGLLEVKKIVTETSVGP